MIKFWTHDNSKDGLRAYDIAYRKVYELLNELGIRIYKSKGSKKKYGVVRIQDQIVEELDRSELQKLPLEYLLKNKSNLSPLEEFELIEEKFRRAIKNIFSEQQITMLNELECEFQRDKKEVSYLYFENGFVEVKKGSALLKKYSELEGCIFKSSIKPWNYKCLTGEELNKSMYSKFIGLVSGDNERKSSIESIIGYLLHNYNDPSNPKVVVLNDEEMSNYPDGGTGKGLLVQGLKHLRQFTSIDAKNTDLNSNFGFQQVNYGDEIVLLDDVLKDFDFKTLFSATTEGLSVEKKHQGKFKIPFEENPKFVITTNYVMKAEGESVKRRLVEFEMTEYFNKDRTPESEFGSTFFGESWTKNEWDKFYNYLIHCIQVYLESGFIKCEGKNLEEKRLIINTSVELVEFLDGFISEELLMDRKELFIKFKCAYDGYDKFSSRKFNKWVEYYSEKRRYRFKVKKSNNLYMFEIKP